MKQVQLVLGDCLDVLKKIPDNSIDCCVCDPPYAYEGGFMGHAWDRFKTPQEFMNFCRRWGREVLRVLKPGGYILSFCGTKTYHWMAVGLELAGFTTRNLISWIYGQGMGKGYDMGQAVEKLLVHGAARRPDRNLGMGRRNQFSENLGKAVKDTGGKIPLTHPLAKKWDDWNTDMVPAQEPIYMGQKPLSEKNFASNVLKHGTGTLNARATRIPLSEKERTAKRTMNRNVRNNDKNEMRWGLNAKSAQNVSVYDQRGRMPKNVVMDEVENAKLGDIAHYFYCAKTSQKEKSMAKQVANIHPTVKPIELMRYLVRLICPPGGIVLDPFTGSGTTALACILEGFRFFGIEKELKYAQIAGQRIRIQLAQRTRSR